MIPRTVVLLFAVVVTTAARCPIGAVQGLRADRCYVFRKEALIFGEAGGNCAYQGGHLVSVSSAFENSFIRLLLAGSDDDYWLGGYALTPGNWVWEDGKNFTYTNWDRGSRSALHGTVVDSLTLVISVRQQLRCEIILCLDAPTLFRTVPSCVPYFTVGVR